MSERDERPKASSGASFSGQRRAPVSGAEFAGLGAAFAVTILVGLFAGQWLDRQLGTGPIMTIGGLFLAAAAAFYSMYRKLVLRQRRSTPPGGPGPGPK